MQRFKTAHNGVSIPAQGHLLPLLDLTHQLICLHGDITVSIIVTPKNLPCLSPLLTAHPSAVSAVTFPFPQNPPSVENVKDIGPSGNTLIMASIRQLREPIVSWLSSHLNPPVAIISDFFLGWTNDLGIPRFAFFSSGAFLASILHFFSDKLHLFESTEPVCLSDLPRSPVFKTEHLPSLSQRSPSTQDLECQRDTMMNFSSYGCVFNSCQCLEGEYLDYVKLKTGHNRVFGVGPLSSTDLCYTSASEVKKVLTKDQCDALALALEKSMTRFVWVAKTDPIPDGLEDRVVGRDQFVDARLLVEHKGVAVIVCEGGDTVPDPNQLGRVLAETMGECGRDVRGRAKAMGQVTQAATEAIKKRKEHPPPSPLPIEAIKKRQDRMPKPPEGPKLCINNCSFFGSPATKNTCSKCHKTILFQQELGLKLASAV
ncbi:hypothetical protein Bca52824_033569 [Brassica carinata]|uniref:A20-type domain-containing protein n=1 Tax=Brassica carinata TaxID=52824 RepID=A0A8X7SEQ0_BRACI|nr:hypothetical protein Bca52824_033569 [Brassica carinata]